MSIRVVKIASILAVFAALSLETAALAQSTPVAPLPASSGAVAPQPPAASVATPPPGAPTSPAGSPPPSSVAPATTASSAPVPPVPPPAEKTAPVGVGTPPEEPSGFAASQRSTPEAVETRSIEAPPTEDPLAWARAVRVGGGATLYYYQPLLPHVKNNLEFYNVRLSVDGKWGVFGFHVEPRIRDTKLRPFYQAPVWIQEAYAFADLGALVIKVGKEYSRLGLFWDNSFYGNVQVYDGLKLAPDYGVSAEGQVGNGLGLRYIGQFFLVDGGTNVSLQGRDTISIPGARRRNEVIGRLEPYVKLGEQSEVSVGLSAQYLRADFPTQHDDVGRYAADAKFTYHGLGVWAELLRQNGKTVTDFPYPGRASGKNNYVLLGAEYTYSRFTLRYNASLGSYTDVSVKEWLHVPGLGYAINDHLSVLGELVFWRRFAPEGNSWSDKSLNFTLNATL